MNVANLENKAISGYEGLYWIREDGEVTSKFRKGAPREFVKHIKNNRGYMYVGLSRNGRVKNHTVHRLVATYFIPNPNGYKYVNHINGVKTDNRIENLEWCTSSQNNAHAYRTGLKTPYVGRTTNKLSDEQVEQIKKFVRLGLPKWAIAQNMGIHRSTLHRLLTGRSKTYARG